MKRHVLSHMNIYIYIYEKRRSINKEIAILKEGVPLKIVTKYSLRNSLNREYRLNITMKCPLGYIIMSHEIKILGNKTKGTATKSY